jgi:monovalent cation/proton antiporter MnhG/PhaG subunit
MRAASLAIIVLLATCVLSTAVCCLALVIFKDVFNRMHYLAPVTSVAMLALLAAVVIQEGWGQATLKTIVVLFVLFLVNAVLTHATARAARVRQFGHWLPQPNENLAGAENPGRTPDNQA